MNRLMKLLIPICALVLLSACGEQKKDSTTPTAEPTNQVEKVEKKVEESGKKAEENKDDAMKKSETAPTE